MFFLNRICFGFDHQKWHKILYILSYNMFKGFKGGYMVYIEYYVIENLVINYIIISCTSILTKRYNPKKNKLLGASLGGA